VTILLRNSSEASQEVNTVIYIWLPVLHNGNSVDHVAMLLRYNNGDIVLLEATGRIGVGLCTWKHFRKMKWHYLYNKLVYRPLRHKRNEDMITQLEHFIRVPFSSIQFVPVKLTRDLNLVEHSWKEIQSYGIKTA
jgi:hypothetical protein